MPLEGGGENGSIMVGMFVSLCSASQKPLEREFFIPAWMDLGVKLLMLILCGVILTLHDSWHVEAILHMYFQYYMAGLVMLYQFYDGQVTAYLIQYYMGNVDISGFFHVISKLHGLIM